MAWSEHGAEMQRLEAEIERLKGDVERLRKQIADDPDIYGNHCCCRWDDLQQPNPKLLQECSVHAKVREENGRLKGELAEALREKDLQVQMREATLSMTVSRLGGLVDGHPTARHNFLQRVDELRAAERELAEHHEHIRGRRDSVIEIDENGTVRKSTVLRDPEPECLGRSQPAQPLVPIVKLPRGSLVPLADVVLALADAVDHLLDEHDCDHERHNTWRSAGRAVRQWVRDTQPAQPEQDAAPTNAWGETLSETHERLKGDLLKAHRQRCVEPGCDEPAPPYCARHRGDWLREQDSRPQPAQPEQGEG